MCNHIMYRLPRPPRRTAPQLHPAVPHLSLWPAAAQVSNLVSRELERECVVVFDEAHNIDNVCIEGLSVNLRHQTLEAAVRNLGRLGASLQRAKETDADRLKAEY